MNNDMLTLYLAYITIGLDQNMSVFLPNVGTPYPTDIMIYKFFKLVPRLDLIEENWFKPPVYHKDSQGNLTPSKPSA